MGWCKRCRLALLEALHWICALRRWAEKVRSDSARAAVNIPAAGLLNFLSAMKYTGPSAVNWGSADTVGRRPPRHPNWKPSLKTWRYKPKWEDVTSFAASVMT